MPYIKAYYKSYNYSDLVLHESKLPYEMCIYIRVDNESSTLYFQYCRTDSMKQYEYTIKNRKKK